MSIALDATYSLGNNLSGVGVYSRKILWGVASAHPQEKFLWCYRSHRILRSFGEALPRNAHRRLLRGNPPGDVFHALNQRVDRRARRTVTTFHDLFVMTGAYSSPEFCERFTEQARGAAEHSDLFIAVSQFTANQMTELLGIDPKRIRVIPHGVDPPQESTAHRERMVLFVGAIQKRKNVARLVKAFEAMPPGWRLVLAGAADGYGAAEELAAVGASTRRADIRVAGYVSTSELEDLYTRASIFAFPSLDEGFGMPVLEAMARGIPVVTSNRSAMPEVAGDAAVLVDPDDVTALGEALTALAKDRDRQQELTKLGLERARQFSWDRAVHSTWSVYEELL